MFGGLNLVQADYDNDGDLNNANPLRQHIGLGDAEQIERLEVYWPASDTTDVFLNVRAKQEVVVREGAKELEKFPAAH